MIEPLAEAHGQLVKAKRPKSPAGKRWVQRRTGQYVPPILPGFTFHEGRHTHRTWPADDGIPVVGRAARLGQKMRGMGGVYEHVRPETKQRILNVLTSRRESSLLALRAQEQERLVAMLPKMERTIAQLAASREVQTGWGAKIIAQSRLRPRPSGGGIGPLTCTFTWWAILGSNQ